MTMRRRYVSRAFRIGSVFAAVLVLAACGSTPEIEEAPAAQPAPGAEPPAAETFPLEGAPPASTASANPTPGPAAPTKPPPATKAPATGDPSAAPVAEPALPPEAVQQFDNAVAMLNAGNFAAAEGA